MYDGLLIPLMHYLFLIIRHNQILAKEYYRHYQKYKSYENEIFIVIIIIITEEGNRQILVFMNALNTHVSSENQNKTNSI